jgi:beta-glucosidase
MAVKLGRTHGVMSSFNRIGTKWTGGDYRLFTAVLRTEWGFEGMVISDFNTNSYMNPKQMAYAGGDLNLASQVYFMWDKYDANSVADVTILRQCAKNILFTIANSNAMNGDIIGYRMPEWVIVMIVIDCVFVVGLTVWGFFSIHNSIRKREWVISLS